MKVPLPRPVLDRLDPISNARLKEIRKFDNAKLLHELSIWKKDSPDWLALGVELRRRENLTARQALWVSIISLILSIITLVVTGIVNTEG